MPEEISFRSRPKLTTAIFFMEFSPSQQDNRRLVLNITRILQPLIRSTFLGIKSTQEENTIKIFHYLSALVMAVLLLGCGSGGGDDITRVTILPSSPYVNVYGSIQFSATVTGAIDTSVTWAIAEGAIGGSVTQGGLYTAPASPGQYHVIAISNEDGSAMDSEVVRVQAMNISIGID